MIMSCTYGVVAGTLVGLASLAFIDDPGENLQYVARGASLGLYVGIGLGIYTAYILPGEIDKQQEQLLEGEGGIANTYAPQSAGLQKARFARVETKQTWSGFLTPTFATDGSVDGAGAFAKLSF